MKFEEIMLLNDIKIKISFLRTQKDRLIKETYFLPDNSSISERIYCIDNKILEIPICRNCENRVNYIKYSKGYSIYCSKNCSNNCKKRINNMKLTNLTKYGVESFMSTDKFKKSSEKTLLERYGVDNYTKSDEYKKIVKDTCIEKYGVDNVSKYELFKEKRMESCNIKYGTPYPNQSQLVRDKYVNTCIEKYGVDNVSKLDEINDKKSKSFIENNLLYDFNKRNEFFEYRRIINNLTRRNRKKIFYEWDGYDYYDNEFILDNLVLNKNHNEYPSIDHKFSVYEGYINKIDPLIISSIDNLCITKRLINSKKNKKNEINFKL